MMLQNTSKRYISTCRLYEPKLRAMIGPSILFMKRYTVTIGIIALILSIMSLSDDTILLRRGINRGKTSFASLTSTQERVLDESHRGVRIASSKENDEVKVEHQKVREGRPVMYTFFHRIDPKKRGTGMDDAADNVMMKAWKEEWNKGGYDTKVLDLNDAKKHPKFKEYEAELKKVPMRGRGGKGVNRYYNELCFYRWLAMSAVGGGWMSDYDVIPLPRSIESRSRPADIHLPNGGAFTVFSIVPGSQGAGIPCLMSGSADEWERMAFGILENALKHQNVVMWTDMFALMELRYHDGAYKWSDAVIPGQDVLIGRHWDNADCRKITPRDKRAVHFSHDAITEGNVTDILGSNTDTPSQRPKIIHHWLSMWQDVCLETLEKAV